LNHTLKSAIKHLEAKEEIAAFVKETKELNKKKE